MIKNAAAALVLGISGCMSAAAANAQVTVNGGIATYTVPPSASVGIDYANAEPLPMPLVEFPPLSQAEGLRTAPDPLLVFGRSGFLPGSVGNGKEDPIRLAPPKQLRRQASRAIRAIRAAFSGDNPPYTTARVNAKDDDTSKYAPFRAAGKLFITHGFNLTHTSTCSGAMIERGLVVTAAHCLTDHGKNAFFRTAEFVPAYNNGAAPYDKWDIAKGIVIEAWVDGTDHCSKVKPTDACDDDIAILTLKPKGDAFAGDSTGWFGIGYDGYGFTTSGQALIDQLGYPGELDKGELMERNDSQGFISVVLELNTVIGSLMAAGSSGGPYLVNLGVTPTPSPFLRFGRDAAPLVVGVASWAQKGVLGEVTMVGASPFRVTNILPLMRKACADTPSAC